jgi:hypothetical protein|tara:strand:- start:34 stop:288 length:255 start_codon:yes stop_codon:yes gene_type:complete
VEKYLKLPSISRLILVNGIVKIVRSTNDLVVTYDDNTTVTITHGTDPRPNIAELEDAIVAALPTKWDEVVHEVESLTITPTGIS